MTPAEAAALAAADARVIAASVLMTVAIVAGLIGVWVECHRAPLYGADERPQR